MAKLNRQQTLVVLALAGGLSRFAAAAKAGITDRTLRRWVAGDPDFADSVEVAVGTGRAMYEELILKHADKDWRAAYQLYESIYIGASKRQPQVTFDEGNRRDDPEDAVATMATPERVAAVIAKLREALPDDDRIVDLLMHRAGNAS